MNFTQITIFHTEGACYRSRDLSSNFVTPSICISETPEAINFILMSSCQKMQNQVEGSVTGVT